MALYEVGAGERPPPDGTDMPCPEGMPILTSWLRLLAEVDWKAILAWPVKTTIRLAKAVFSR